ncbi:actin patches distal protein [Plectosphaerella cucumerina]|uniref:Actin patches distal protein n=1 Tax=Plectosphaerella cucumerina TaxID=40658 RepID=A0A8K0X5S6_9PEZI|nr:actin patches distal protein [Plectosphaerella cucumerina]
MVFKSLIDSAKKLALGTTGAAPLGELFTKTDPAVDGEECSHDCESCHIKYPRGFKIETEDKFYGLIQGWSTHALVATGKTDWVREISDEKGSVMEAFEKADKPNNGRLMISATNIPTPNGTTSYDQPTTVLLLPEFTIVDNVTPQNVPALVSDIIEQAPTTTSPLAPITIPPPDALAAPAADAPSLPPQLSRRPCPHSVLILLCSQKTRDARCGQSAPLIRKELERHLRPLGLFRDLDDERPGGVGIYLVSHVGGHKYSANVIVYRRHDAFGLDSVQRVAGEELRPKRREDLPAEDVGAGQGIWLARIMPEDCENLVRYTVLQGKVVKPETQLRAGFDRAKGLMSW